MAKLQRTFLFPATAEITEPTTKSWARKLTTFLDETFRKVSAIPFNQSESLSVADTGNANTEFSVTHHLGRVPNGYILTKSNLACNIYDSGTTWTTDLIYLKCDTANAVIEVTVF